MTAHGFQVEKSCAVIDRAYKEVIAGISSGFETECPASQRCNLAFTEAVEKPVEKPLSGGLIPR